MESCRLPVPDSLFGNFSLADGINSLVSGGHENYGQEMKLLIYLRQKNIKTD